MLLVILLPARLLGQEPASEPPLGSGDAVVTAPVVVDGAELFRVRGVSALPAADRAAQIADRIRQVARDPAVTPESLRIESSEIGPRIMAGERVIATVVDADARLEGISRRELAEAVLERIRTAVRDYRAARSQEALVTASISALVVTLILVAALWGLVWLWRRVDALLERKVRRRAEELEAKSKQILRAGQLLGAIRGVLRVARTLAVIALVYLLASFTLALFPWTRWIANRLGHWILGPLRAMAEAALAQIPNLIFLAILFLLVRWALGLIRLFFEAIEQRRVEFEGFEAEWAMPTYKMVRLLVVAFAVVIAYPYIPGSESAAFKGISIFLGVIVSLGSSSAISNTIAGFLMTYRRTFRIGDRVEIGDTVGTVTEIRLQVTHLRTAKNEEVVVPNSTILTTAVKNYSTLARSHGLVLHTTVGIGYETPWRQVEAMLLMAAERTPGLLREPPPWVLQRSLGDFAITYELNACCDDPARMLQLYSALHRNILDAFNEYGVAIMTPAYESDPAEPKVVPREQWFAAPASGGPGERPAESPEDRSS